MFVDIGGKPVCLVCGGNVAVIKEYNIRRHYETKHEDKYKDLNIQQKLQKVEELKKSLVSQQTMFTKAKSQSEAVVKASYIVAEEIALKLPWDKLTGLTERPQCAGKRVD